MAYRWRVRYGHWCATYLTDAVSVLCYLASKRGSENLRPELFSLERRP